MSNLSIDTLRVMAMDKIITMNKPELCSFLEVAIDLDHESLIECFKSWVECKGLFHCAEKLGHGTTRHIERWIKDQTVPKEYKARILRIIKQEGLI